MASRKPKATKKATRKKRKPFAILDMPEESWWAEHRTKPRFMMPVEFSLSPCATCPGKCCLPENAFTTVEATRIALTLLLPLPTFAKVTRVGDATPQKHTVPFPLDDAGEYVLSFQPLVQPHGDETCVFLHRVGEVGRCSIHSVRPGVCRMYPYRVELGDRVLHAGMPLTCPSQWLQNASVRRRVRKDTESWLRDLERERELVEEWRSAEEEDRTLAGYARWAASVLAPELGLDFEALYPPRRRRLGDRFRPEPDQS